MVVYAIGEFVQTTRYHPSSAFNLHRWRVLFGLLVMIVVFLFGHWSANLKAFVSESGDRKSDMKVLVRAVTEKNNSQRRPTGSTAYKPNSLEANYETAAIKINKKHRAREFIRLLWAQLEQDLALQRNGEPIEAIVNRQQMFVHGTIQALKVLAPELIDELSVAIEEEMCKPNATDVQRIILTRIYQMLPKVASSEALDCIFKTRVQEDIVLWTALEAWRNAHLLKTDAIKQIEARFKDPRTLIRLHGKERLDLALEGTEDFYATTDKGVE